MPPSPPAAQAPSTAPAPRLLALAFALPLLAVAAILARTFTALPMLDDYNASLNFLLREQALPTVSARLLHALAEQQAEYKFLLLHLLQLAQYTLTGHLSFGALTLTGDLLLLPLLACLVANSFPDIPSRNHRLTLALPVLYLSCQLTFAELFNWSLASWNALAVVSFGALALHLLFHRPPPSPHGPTPSLFNEERIITPVDLFPVKVHRHQILRTALACLALLLACASSTNAFLLAPVVLLLLLRERRLRAAAAWSLGTAAALALYLFRLHPVPHPAPPPLLTRLVFLLSFLGGAVEDMHRQPIHGAALLLGTLLLLVLLDALRTGFPRHNPFFTALSTWAVLSAAAVSNFRSSIGLFQSLSSRYKLYSTLLLVFTYVYLAHRARHAPTLSPARRRSLFLAALALALLFNVAGNLAGFGFLHRRQQTVQRGMRAYLADPAHISPLANQGASTWSQPEADFEQQSLTAAIGAHLYTPPRP